VDDDWFMPIASKTVVAPSAIVAAIAGFRESLSRGKNSAVLIGAWAQQHPQAGAIYAAAQALGVTVGVFGEAANSVGGYIAGLPTQGDVRSVLQQKTIVLMNVEPELDCADGRGAAQALKHADFVVSLSSWKTNLDYADVLLPIGPFTETAGTFINCEGRVQGFNGVVPPLGQTRPGWKVLRVLGTMLGLPGFDLDSIEQVREQMLGAQPDVASRLANGVRLPLATPAATAAGVERVADVPIHFADPLARRSEPLQRTADARPPRARMHSALFEHLGLAEGEQVKIRQGSGEAVLAAEIDSCVPPGVVRIAAAHPSTCGLDGLSGPVTVERA
jgi:NADH-quinone oxidoreductase subunit G